MIKKIFSTLELIDTLWNVNAYEETEVSARKKN